MPFARRSAPSSGRPAKRTESRYGAGDASRRIKDVLVRIPLDGLIRKSFVDLPGPPAGRASP